MTSMSVEPTTSTALRYHAIGNAVTPPVAQWVGERLANVLARARP